MLIGTPTRSLIFSALALLLWISVPAAYGAASGIELFERFQALSEEVSGIERDSVNLEQRISNATYACPPNTPSKEPHRQEISGLAQRRISANRKFREILDERALLGRAGEGQGSSGKIITDTQVNRLNERLRNMARATTRQINQLNNKPKTDKDCDPAANPLATIAVPPPPSLEPGQTFTISISGKLADGTTDAVIDSVTTRNIANIGTELAHAGAGTINYSIQVKISDVRRQGPFPIGLTINTKNGSMNHNLSYTVKNVAPTISSTPGDPSANPGENMSYKGQIIVIDKNADARNAREIIPGLFRLTHPSPELETIPGQAFSRLGRLRRVSHDPATGRYVFDVSRVARVKDPHKHGAWSSNLTVSDQKGASATQAVTFTVNNVAPTVQIRVSPRRNYRANDGDDVELHGEVYDKNGADDILEVAIDATNALGRTFRLSGGEIRKTNVTKHGFRFFTQPRGVPHTNNPGEHIITGSVEDTGTPTLSAPIHTSIFVGNEEPVVNAYGYIYDGTLHGPDAGGQIQLCPGQLFKAANNARDLEGDALEVTAQITPGGAAQKMAIAPGETSYTLWMTAPKAPGTYTLTFLIKEVGVTPAREVTKTITLTVRDCSDPADKPAIALGGSGDGATITIGTQPGNGVRITAPTPTLPGGQAPVDPSTAVGVSLYNWSLDWLDLFFELLNGGTSPHDDTPTPAVPDNPTGYVTDRWNWDLNYGWLRLPELDLKQDDYDQCDATEAKVSPLLTYELLKNGLYTYAPMFDYSYDAKDDESVEYDLEAVQNWSLRYAFDGGGMTQIDPPTLDLSEPATDEPTTNEATTDEEEIDEYEESFEVQLKYSFGGGMTQIDPPTLDLDAKIKEDEAIRRELGTESELFLDGLRASQWGVGSRYKPELSDWINYEFPAKEEESIIDELDRRSNIFKGYLEGYNDLQSTFEHKLNQTNDEAERATINSLLGNFGDTQAEIKKVVEEVEETQRSYETDSDAPIWQFRMELKHRIDHELRIGLDYNISSSDTMSGVELTYPEATKAELGNTPLPLIDGAGSPYRSLVVGNRDIAAAESKLVVLDDVFESSLFGSVERQAIEGMQREAEQQKSIGERLINDQGMLSAAGFDIDLLNGGLNTVLDMGREVIPKQAARAWNGALTNTQLTPPDSWATLNGASEGTKTRTDQRTPGAAETSGGVQDALRGLNNTTSSIQRANPDLSRSQAMQEAVNRVSAELSYRSEFGFSHPVLDRFALSYDKSANGAGDALLNETLDELSQDLGNRSTAARAITQTMAGNTLQPQSKWTLGYSDAFRREFSLGTIGLAEGFSRQEGASQDPLFAKADASGYANIQWQAEYNWGGKYNIQFDADYNAESFYAKTSDLEAAGSLDDMTAFGGRFLNHFSLNGTKYSSVIYDQSKGAEFSQWLGEVRVDNNTCRETEHVLPSTTPPSSNASNSPVRAYRAGNIEFGGVSP